ncbi:3-demethylubiquinone-9 3-methyltransferase [Dermatophilus congolensis]|uniref:3-demethylubiquinone-9 3-methyltransferase n=1 Tax=Dermatophilus congolensis TaxID=1863 RepID=A0AA46GZI3_9MICO|nr:class I SAM-dependent methyltransferase [Dermatophilus congolensis]STD03383.1 3-demethylubiquinone-9 3-methyltransferase [Dermatophilus congolensis]
MSHEHSGNSDATYFNDAAKTWDSPEKTARSQRIADAIRQRIPMSSAWRVLDLGAGTGQLGRALAEQVAHVLLIDTSEGMIDVAMDAIADHPRVQARVHNLLDEPLNDSFDLVVSAMALHHIPDTRAALRSIRGALAPGGWVSLADLDHDPENLFHADTHTGHRGIERDVLREDLVREGFVDVQVETVATVVKAKGGVAREFSVFLATGHL